MKKTQPTPGSFEYAELFRLRMSLKSTHAQRLQDLEDMINFNEEAQAGNPRLRRAVEVLRNSQKSHRS